MNNNPVLFVKAKRYGWKDFVVNVVFSLIMASSIVVVILIAPPDTVSNWVLAMFTTLLPLFIFANRVVKDLFYTRDFIKIDQERIYYRSTPLLTTGFIQVKKGELSIREIRKFGLSKIPRKLSLDLRREKDKGILVISLKNGKEIFMGEYIPNDSLFEVCKVIPEIYPKARLAKSTLNHFPELTKYIPSTKVSKKAKKLEDDDLEGVEIRR